MGRLRVTFNLSTASWVFMGFALFIGNSFAQEVPSLQDVISAQRRCDQEAFKKLGWAKVPGLGNLATKSWAIISDLKISELPGRIQSPISRKFKVSFKGWDMLSCGQMTDTLNRPVEPVSREIVFTLREWSKEDHRLFLGADDKNPDGTFSNLWNQFLFTPIEEGRNEKNGLTCFVDKEDFIKDLNAVILEKLCKDEPAAKLRASQEYLKTLQRKLR